MASSLSPSSSSYLCSKTKKEDDFDNKDNKNNYYGSTTTTTTTTTKSTMIRALTKTSPTTLSLSSSSERDRTDDCYDNDDDNENYDDVSEHQQRQHQRHQTEQHAGPKKKTGPKILQLAIPALGALLIDPLLTIADTAFVGKYSTTTSELAGMGSATALLTFSFYIFNFLCTATTPLVAQKRAAAASSSLNDKQQNNNNDDNEAAAIQVGGQALSLALMLGTVLSFGLIVFGQPLLELMGTSVTKGPLANKYAMEFLVVRSLAAPAVFTISASTGILRGYLDTKTPIIVLLAANIINFTLDVIFIADLKMGPLGAALATTTAEGISAILFLLVLAGKLPSMDGELGRKKNNINNNNNIITQQTKEGAEKEDTIPLLSRGEEPKATEGTSTTTPVTTTTTQQLVVTPSLSIPPWDEIRPLVVASSAVFFRSTVLQLFLSTAAAFAARAPGGLGVAESSISAHQIAFQLWMLCSYTSDALAAASQALVADAIGRDDMNDVQDVSRTVFVFCSILGILLGTMLYIGFEANFLFDFFTNDEGTQMHLLAISSLLVFSQPLNSLVFAADGVLQGAAEFPYQAKTMSLSATVAAGSFMIFQSIDPSTDELIHVWDAIIILQAARGLTSAYKICDNNGPIRILSPADKNV